MKPSGRPIWPIVSALLHLGLTPDEVRNHVGLRAIEFWRRKTGGVVRAEDVPSWAWARVRTMVSDDRQGVALAEWYRARARAALARNSARQRAPRSYHG